MKRWVLGIVLGGGLVMLGGVASATTYNITTTNMTLSAPGCGLAEAIVAVNTRAAAYGCSAGTGSDTIQLQAATYVALGTLQINRPVTIKGVNPDPTRFVPGTTIAASGSVTGGALFYVADTHGTMSVTFQNLDLEGGLLNGISGIWASGSSGTSTVHVLGSWVVAFSFSGMYANSFNVDVQDSYIANNTTPESGGGIFFDAGSHNLTVSRSTIDSNTASSNGGGITYYGTGTSSLVSTIVTNNGSTLGGGVDIEGDTGSFAISQSTIVYNGCSANGPDYGLQSCGGGVLSLSGDGTGNFSINASILAYANSDKPNAHDPDLDGDGVIGVSNSDILITSGTRYSDWGGNSHMGQDPLIESGAGGEMIRLQGVYHIPINPFSPAPNSPIVDVLSTLSPAVDILGFPRGISKTTGLPGSTKFDMGAVEYDPNTETEALGVVGNSGSYTTASGSSYSGGKIFQLKATKAGDYATFPIGTYLVDGQPSRNYNFVAGFVQGPNEGMVQLEVSTDRTFATGVTAIGSRVDLYSNTTRTYVRNYNVAIPLDNDFSYYIRLRVTGKNSASTGYAVYSDYVNTNLLN